MGFLDAVAVVAGAFDRAWAGSVPPWWVDLAGDLGQALYVAVSDTPAWVVAKAVTLAEARGWAPFVALQVPYSLVERTAERELLPMARALDLAVTAWSPLADGLLSGRYGSDRSHPDDSRVAALACHRLNPRNIGIADAVNTVAGARGVSSAQVAIAWLCAQQRRAEIIPIVGVRTPAQLDDNLGALDIELSDEERSLLEEASVIELGFPLDFGGFRLAYGETLDLIDNHRPQLEVPL